MQERNNNKSMTKANREARGKKHDRKEEMVLFCTSHQHILEYRNIANLCRAQPRI